MAIINSKLIVGISILIGTCVGAGVLGIPYVAAQAGFLPALIYIILIGGIILLVNLYLGEISLRTIGDHQIPGYAKAYLGKTGRILTEFATVFGIYSALVAYILGMGESLSFLFFGSGLHTLIFGITVGILMSALLWRGAYSLKKYEKIGVAIVLFLLLIIVGLFLGDVDISNLSNFNMANIFVPFGVVLFALMSFHAIPEVRLTIHKNEKSMKKIILTSFFIVILFYILFTLVVVGTQGTNTPQIATLSLGKIFVFLGLFTMFTSYLAMGNALIEDFVFDERVKRKNSWFLASVVPIFLFIIVKSLEGFSFTDILGMGGVISGGLTAVLVLFMVRNAKKKGERKPEYSIPVNWFVITLLILIFVAGVFAELGLFG